jgi:hypothetical protein
MLSVPVLLFLAGAVILVGVVAVAIGRGGEMAEFAGDYLPPTMDDVITAADVASVRPPSALWGYNVQVTDEAFNRIAQVVTERDVEIAVLRQQLADLRSATGSQPSPTAELRAARETGARSRPDRQASARAPGPARPQPGSAGQPPAAGSSEPGAAGDSAGRAEQAAAGEAPVTDEPSGAGSLASEGESVSAGAPDGGTPSWWAGPADGATANRDE